MDLKAGYKQTEVGVIPEDWEVKPLGGIASIATGNTPPTRDPSNYGDEFMFVSPVDMGTTKHILRTERMLSKKGFSISRRFPKGSILFVCIGSTIGKCGIAPATLTSNQQINAILPVEGLSSDYLFYAVSAVAAKVRSLAGEQAVPIVNKTLFSNTVIPLPPTKAEKEAIAEALSDADALIESLEQLLTKKRLLKKGTMQELLTGNERLPGFNGKWEVRPLGAEVTALDSGVSVKSVDAAAALEPGNAAILKTSCVDRGVFMPAECKRIASRDVSRAKLNPRADTVLISRMNTIDLVGECGYVDADYPYLFVPDRLWMTRFRKDSEVSAKWLSYTLSSEHYRALLKAAATGTSGSMKNIAKGFLLSLDITFPPVLEQTAIAAILSDMDAEITALEAKQAKARQIKQGMMQELLTGRIRLI